MRARPAHGPILPAVRLTIPAREALERSGNPVAAPAPEERFGPPLPEEHQYYRVELRRPPAGLELALIGHGAGQHRGIRLESEPEYPGEWPSGAGVSWSERGELVPCPRCGAALAWCEAGYVPGWRMCLDGHMAQLDNAGRSAQPR